MYEFEELFGCKFGDHMKKTIRLSDREAVIHVRTGNMSELDARFIVGAGQFIPGWGPDLEVSFAEEGGEPLDFNSMYLSANGLDPMAEKKTGSPYIPRVPRENAALKPNTDYFLSYKVLEQGVPGMRLSIPLTYAGSDYDGQYIIQASSGSASEIIINGVPGTWVPHE